MNKLHLASVAVLLTLFAGTLHAQDAAPSKDQLDQLVKKARDFSEKEYSYTSWNDMRFALSELSSMIRRGDADAAALNQAVGKLNQKIESLEKRQVESVELPRLGLAATLFASSANSPVNQVSLQWASSQSFDLAELFRSNEKEGQYEKIYSGRGTSFSDSISLGSNAYFKIIIHRGEEKLTSNIQSVTAIPMPEGLSTYTNQQATESRLPSKPIQVGNTYYRFQTFKEGKAMKHVLMYTSADGKNWSEGSPVMDQNSHPDLADFKFEAETIMYDKNNDQILWWCHWEKAQGYAAGKAFVASAKPGQPFKVHRIFNPMGVEVRDMSIYIDEDKKGYLVAASNVPGQGANATLYIFRLNDTYDDVTGIVAKIAENNYREAPHIVKKDGYYYLFFSQAAGWYPSVGGYSTAKSMNGPWTDPRPIGNNSTFSSQSGGILKFGFADTKVPLMMGNRWVRSEGTSRNSVLPIQFAEGFAFYDYFPFLLYDADKSILIPQQLGKLLSQDKPAEASIPGKPAHEPAQAFDGSYATTFQSDKKEWPFTISTDLGSTCEVKNVQVSWLMHKGSEAFYTYQIEGSTDGKEWKVLVDRSDKTSNLLNKTYGFTSDILPEKSAARFVRLKVLNAHLQNNPDRNWYAPTINEIKVFGEPIAEK